LSQPDDHQIEHATPSEAAVADKIRAAGATIASIAKGTDDVWTCTVIRITTIEAITVRASTRLGALKAALPALG
jgi:hypothetical protein